MVREQETTTTVLPATAAIAAVATTTAAITSTTSALTRLRLVHFQATTFHLKVVELADGGLSRAFVAHFHEAEAP